MRAITGVNTWDYTMMLERMAADYYQPKNRQQRGEFHRKVAKPRAKRSLKSSHTDIKYWPHMTGAQRLTYAALVRVFDKSAGHKYIRKLKLRAKS